MYIAIDQALNTSGIAIFNEECSLVEYAKFTTNAKFQTGQKLVQFKEFIEDMVKDKNPLKIAFEEIQLQTNMPGGDNLNNVKTFKKLAYVQAILMEICVRENIDFEIISSSTWKSTCGIGGRNRQEQKKNAQEYVFKEFGIEAVQDICDAICIGVHAFQKPASEINWE